MRSIVAVAACLMLTGCSTMFGGTHQTISVESMPMGAHCDLLRDGKRIASVAATPRKVRVSRAKYDIIVRCTLPGYQTGIERLHSGSATDHNGLAGPLIGAVAGVGVLVDAASGAANQYPYGVNVELLPAPGMYPVPPRY